MQFRPDATTLAACLALAAVAWLAWGAPQAAIVLPDAAAHEGQAVRVAGQAQGVRSDAGGGGSSRTRFELHADGTRLAVRALQPVAEGAWVEASGLIGRSGGLLTLFADEVKEASPPPASAVPLRTVAAEPGRWLGRLVAVEGTVERGHLRDGEGHRVALEGDWTPGPQVVHGTLAYRPACLCHVLVAVAAWTP